MVGLLDLELHQLLLVPLLVFLWGVCLSLLEARIDLVVPIA